MALSATLTVDAASAARPGSGGEVVLTGTYQAIGLSTAGDEPGHDHSSHDHGVRGDHAKGEHPRIDVLQVGDEQYRLKLPPKKRPTGGSVIRATGTLDGKVLTASDVEVVSAYGAPATTGTTKVLVIRTYWATTSAPATPSLATTESVIKTAGNAWFKEASYGQLATAVTVVPVWMKITAPTGSYCTDAGGDAMRKAEAKAKAYSATYDAAKYQRTILYFPSASWGCAPGWAYMPGNKVWLNGSLDNALSVHEQGHNYGLEHSHDYHCPATGGVHATLGAKSTCMYNEYGDRFDAMGYGEYDGGHYAGPQKNRLGWLTSGRVFAPLRNGTKYYLTPFETATGKKTARITISSTRSYWVEWRRPIGKDAKLPAGATAGVLIHLKDSSIAPGPLLLDMSPNGDSTTAVLAYNRYWTSPEGVRFFVGTPTSTSVPVWFTSGNPAPTKPSAPRSVSATAGDQKVTVKWAAPSSTGGSSIVDYRVNAAGMNPIVVSGSATSAVVPYLTNGTSYSFTVTARNASGLSVASAAVTAKPVPALPTVTLGASPAEGSVVKGIVTLTATATPHPVTKTPITRVDFYDGSQQIDSDYEAPYSVQWDTYRSGDGARTLTAKAVAGTWQSERVGTSPARHVTVSNPASTVVITSPANGASLSGASTLLKATATPPAGYSVRDVSFFNGLQELRNDWDGTDGWSYEWDTSTFWGQRTVTAKVRDDSPSGKTGVSAPITVNFTNDVAKGTLTSPAAGAKLEGTVQLTATAVPASNGRPVTAVYFLVNGYRLSSASAVPENGVWKQTWDTTGRYQYGPVDISVEAEYTVTDENGWEETRSGLSPSTRVTVLEPRPTVSIVSPAAGALVKPGAKITLSAVATPNPHTGDEIRSVTFYDGTGFACYGELVAGKWSCVWDTWGRVGTRSITAVADDWSFQGRSAVRSVRMVSPTLTASPTTVTYGSATKLTATLKTAGTTTPVVNAPVYLDQRVRGATAWTLGTTPLATSATGTVSWYRSPTRHYDYRVRYDKVGDGVAGFASATRAVNVKIKLVDSISRSTMTYGSTATLSGTVSPVSPLVGKPAYLQRYYSGAWHTEGASKAISSTGKVAFYLKPPRGTRYYRIYVKATTTLAGVTGTSRKLVIT